MLDCYIIEELKRQEEKERANENVIQLPLYDEDSFEEQSRPEKEKENKDIIVINL